MTYAVALCGLTARDSRLLEIVVNRASSGRHAFHAAEVENTADPRVVIVDAGSPRSMELYETLRQQHPGVISVTISDHGMAGDTRYRIQRKSLLLHVMKVLDDLADHEFVGSKVRAHPATTAPAAQPGADTGGTAEAAFVAGGAGEPRPLRALVVDDSLTVREQMRQALQRIGIASDLADSAEAAMRLLEHGSYDLEIGRAHV